MKPFISCNHPVRVNTSKGVRFVSCGHCTQCMNAKRARTSLLLDLEGQHCKYVEFITLTYKDEFLPRLDFNDYFRNIHDCGLSYDNLPIKLGKRYVKNFGKYELDTTAQNVVLPFSKFSKYYGYQEYFKYLQEYNKRVNLYFQRHPDRQRGVRKNNVVPILWYSDLQKYIKRLRFFAKKTFDIQFRYFAIGEYGTESLRPHWHILLCHNSYEFHRIFDEVVDLPGNTSINIRQCSTALYRAALWSYGDCVTSTTDKGLSSYLASYVNQSADFPQILAPFPQKTFHSIFLGEHRDFEQITSLFRRQDWEQLCTTTVQDSNGCERNVSVPSSSYNRFNIRLSCVNLQDVQTSYELLHTTKQLLDKYLRETGEIVNIYEETSLYSFYNWCSSYTVGNTYFADYFNTVIRSSFVSRNILNPLYQLCYGVKKLYKMSNLLGFTPYQYLTYLAKFRSWLDLKNLNKQFEMLEMDDNYSYQYYTVIDPITGVYDIKKLFASPLFMSQQQDANMQYWSDIKHREVADTYKF